MVLAAEGMLVYIVLDGNKADLCAMDREKYTVVLRVWYG